MFGKPSDASKKAVESGSVTLPDGVVIRVGEVDKAYVLAISQRYRIDEVQALILMRSFFYNSGMPDVSDSEQAAVELAEAIGGFYFLERLNSVRILIPLFRAREDETELLYKVAIEFLPQIIPDGPKFAQSVLDAYLEKTKMVLPERYKEDPKAASIWAKQNLNEQLVLLEVLFWTMWGFVPCNGSLVVAIFSAAYDTNLGSIQANNTLLLDDESRYTIEDCAAIWILITIEVLELEELSEPDAIELSDIPSRSDFYCASPSSLQRLHDIVTTHQNSQYSVTFLAWTYVISRLTARAEEVSEIPASFSTFLSTLNPPLNRPYSKDREPLHVQMVKASLEPEVGLFKLLEHLLTRSPLFVTSIAWRQGSCITNPNAIAYRSVIKGTILQSFPFIVRQVSLGLIVALAELQPVELFSDLEGFMEIWIALYGRSESSSVAAICDQFWAADWNHGIARRAIFDAARSRFPIQVKPLFRLLRAMSGTGFLDTDPLYVAESPQDKVLSEGRNMCSRFVYHYFLKLPSYSQIVPVSACTGPQALYERQTERFGGSSTGSILAYHNLRPIRLPGGSILPAKSTGRLLSSDGGDQIVICWQHQNSGWKVILEILTDYLNKRRIDFGSGVNYRDVSFGPRRVEQFKSLRIEDIGVELDDMDGDESTITDALDLVRCVIKDNPSLAATLMHELEDDQPVVCHTITESQPPDLVQLTTMILEEALSRSASPHHSSWTKLVTSAMSVLSAVLSVPEYTNRVWLYIRSTTALFGGNSTDRKVSAFASVALASEKATGQYTMTLALLHLAESLFKQAYSFILPDNKKLMQLKEEVLLRVMSFVHGGVWVEHLSWKYNQLGDRFEIGQRVLGLYLQVLVNTPPTNAASSDGPFPLLNQAVAAALLFKGTTSAINPIISIITFGDQMLKMLWSTRRYEDIRNLVYLLHSTLRISRLLLTYKLNSPIAKQSCFLEQALSVRVVSSGSLKENLQTLHDPVDVIAGYIKNRQIGADVPVEATRLLSALLSSLSASQSSPPTLIGHFSDSEATVSSLIRIIQHPYDELALRKAIWNFVSLAVDKEPALARLLVARKSGISLESEDAKKAECEKGKSKEGEQSKEEKADVDLLGYKNNALDAACDILVNWKAIWEANPLILSCVLRFLDVVWQHALEHKKALELHRNNGEFWERIVAIACYEVGPVPEYTPSEIIVVDGIRRSSLHESIQAHAYRSLAKSHALRILTRDIGLYLHQHRSEVPPKKPQSYLKLEPYFKSQDQLTDLLAEAAPSSYAPQFHDEVVSLLQEHFQGLTLSQQEQHDPLPDREYGENFTFSIGLLRLRLQAYPIPLNMMEDPSEKVEKLMMTVNLNLSLAHSELALIEAWNALLRQVIPYLRVDAAVRPHILAIAASISYDIASEKRSGEMMSNIHGARLSLVLALLEVAWFSTKDTKGELESFMELTRNLRGIILNEGQSPAQSLLSSSSNPFHRTLLQIIFFFAKQARSLINRPKVLNAEQRLTIASTVEAVLTFVIEALRVVFTAAKSRSDTDLDRDMELLIAVFEQCMRPDLVTTSSFWLAKCQEMDVIHASLELYVHLDLAGSSDLSLLLSRKQPLYAPHVLLFHMALSCSPVAAERLASEGILTAYSNTRISSIISSGRLDAVLPDVPGHRNPGHLAYCSMLSIVAMVISALGRQNHYFDSEACGFVQLYGDQISRALSWTIGDPITLPLLEEIDQVVNLFYAIAISVPYAAKPDPVVSKVLRVFTTHALQLLQQVNYAITHPNHLVSLYEPVTHDERVSYEKTQTETDLMKRPIVMHLMHRFFKLSSNILGTLTVISRADVVLATGVDDWPLQEALVVPVRFFQIF